MSVSHWQDAVSVISPSPRGVSFNSKTLDFLPFIVSVNTSRSMMFLTNLATYPIRPTLCCPPFLRYPQYEGGSMYKESTILFLGSDLMV
eukprot:10165534-Ditylum_brightwellii.AAC.2